MNVSMMPKLTIWKDTLLSTSTDSNKTEDDKINIDMHNKAAVENVVRIKCEEWRVKCFWILSIWYGRMLWYGHQLFASVYLWTYFFLVHKISSYPLQISYFFDLLKWLCCEHKGRRPVPKWWTGPSASGIGPTVINNLGPVPN